MRLGMITLYDNTARSDNDSIISFILYTYGSGVLIETVRYHAGEGLIGIILDAGSTIVVDKVINEPLFLGRLGLYDPELLFNG